ncbi:PLP-dependent aminotransferase family protein (plasmid) [Lichenicola cladoniae]|uniref:PLP-dependent aminotransferase family protein n=1 Tax=Lichenicola cladoniae TaxID=1484109 RepID=A0A6M8I0B7_9PROT|nr:PLP-dependent aminotransferase family protein [Lichenicola cladoniae]NPD69862.1 PLP-dependent aminotransferase family protein [Acetobacteraceae bacterium]QKE93837.1 PLP-dependent aminotransferase family protein [Lichenicola cladoniae]
MEQTSGDRPTTRIDGIVERFRRMIEAGLLKPGERIASVRQAAVDHAVSKNTVAEAYDRLVGLGHLEARPGSGYFVAAGARLAQSRPSPHVAEALDLVSLLREQLDHHYDVRPGDGRPPASWMAGSKLGLQFRRAHSHAGIEFGYGSSWGYLPLRERICLSLAERSVVCAPEQVLLTQGANHALDLIIRHLLEPGDVVFVDDPGYYPLFGKLRLAKVRMVGIRRRPDGPDLADLADNLAKVRPKLFFTQSLAHNPTGGTLSLPVAYGVLQAAERHGFAIVEDDAFADIVSPARPRLAALDGLKRVLYVGTFAKTLSASLRVGFVASSPALAQGLADLKLLTVVATSDHVEHFVFDLIADGHYQRHLRRLRARVQEVTTKAIVDLERVGLKLAHPRDGGFYLWAELPLALDELLLCRHAAADGIFLAPGGVFSPERALRRPAAIRINVAHASQPRFLSFLRHMLASAD